MTVYFKYTSESDNKYINRESLLQVFFWIRKCVAKISKSQVLSHGILFYMHFKNRFKVYLKYTSLLNFWWTQSILETYIFQIIFQCHKLWKSKYLQKYIWSILHIYSTEVYLKYSSISAGQNINKSLHNLWSKWPSG